MAYYTYPNGETYSFNFEPAGDGARRVSNAEGKRMRAEHCRAQLVKLLDEGATVYCILRSVSASGMSRRISLSTVEAGKLRTLDHLAADAMGYRVSDKGGLVVGGCGMDMGFHIVDSLASTIGRKLKHEWV